MASKKKYSQAFYDDGLGDLLEWIDDEILVHSEERALKNKKADDSDSESERRPKKKFKKELVEKNEATRQKLYGDNDVSEIFKPSKRVKYDMGGDTDSKTDKKIQDRARGLINRLAAQTMSFVTSEFEKLYASNSRSAVSESIFSLVQASLIQSDAMAKRKLVAELMLLISYLDSKVSHGIGASFVHKMIRQFENLDSSDDKNDDDKRLDNIVTCLVNLYYIGLISSNIIFELTKRICTHEFRPKSVELLLLITKSVGFQLRKDNPSLMRQFILQAHECCRKLKAHSNVETRVEFMMETLSAIKNNNMSKLGNYGCDIDKDTIESTLKALIKRTKLPESLSDASYEEILNSANWYLLETRLEGDKKVDYKVDDKTASDTKTGTTTSKSEAKICKALGFSKPAEKTIFCSLLRVSDCVEASNILIGFGLTHCSDAMLVCIHVAIHEKKYNPFYYDVINNLCKFNRRYKMAAKFAIQDKIRLLGRMPMQRANIFKQLCFELIKSDAVPITILKAVEWADLSASTKEYLSFLLQNISKLMDENRHKVMSKVDKKSSFAGAMRTFTKCFLKDCNLFN